MRKKIDLLKQKFGRLTVIEEAGRAKDGKVLWKCLCDCGKITVVIGKNLRNGNTQSCGCLRIKHGMGKTRTYNSWAQMLYRCNNPKSPDYKDYGNQGIIVCEYWHKFLNFFKDMGLRPNETTIDRVDPYGNYEASNCRWATPSEQCRNQRLHKRNKTSINGVVWDKSRQKYRAQITINGKGYNLGRFADLEQAAIVRKQAELIYWEKAT